MSISSLIVSPVNLLAKNMSVETAVTLVIVNLAIGGMSNVYAIGQAIYVVGKLACKAVWIPSKYIYDKTRSEPSKSSEEIEEDFVVIENEVVVIKVSELARLLQNKNFDPNVVYQVISDEKA